MMTAEETASGKVSAEENLGLVRLCANRFRGKGIEYEELYSAGCIGLLKAVNAFDGSRGVKFSTYAVPVILGEIKRLFRDGGSVRISRSLKELSQRAARERERFFIRAGREPTVTELAEALGVTPEQAAEAVAALSPTVSLTADFDDEEVQLDIPTESPMTKLIDLLALRQVMAALDEQDKRLIILRYFKEKTQNETAEILGMTQVQVSRREKKILALMRERLT